MIDLSVVLTTYNGARYLEAQLDSIARQTRRPAELVVSDDGSTDATPRIVEAFARRAPFPVSWSVASSGLTSGAPPGDGTRARLAPLRSASLGCTQNFGRGVGLARGELIALCDQDDVWLPNKLELTVAELERHPEVGAVIGDAIVTDAELRSTGRRNLRTEDVERFRRLGAYDALLGFNIAQGATLVFRACWKGLVLPFPSEWVHDAWIALLVAAVSDVALVEAPLLYYRQHASNQLGHTDLEPKALLRRLKGTGFDHCRRQLAKYQLAEARLRSDGRISAGRLRALEEKVQHLALRSALPDSRLRRVPAVIEELARGGYHRYARGAWSAARDLVV